MAGLNPHADNTRGGNNALGVNNARFPGVINARKVNNARFSGVIHFPGVKNGNPGVNNARPGVNNARPGVNKARAGVNKARPGVINARPGVNNARSTNTYFPCDIVTNLSVMECFACNVPIKKVFERFSIFHLRCIR